MTPTTTLARLAALALLSTAAPAALAQATIDAPAPAPGASQDAPAPGQAPPTTDAQAADATPAPATDAAPVDAQAETPAATGTDAQPDAQAAPAPQPTEAAPMTDAQPAGDAAADATDADALETDVLETDVLETDAPETDAPDANVPETDAPATDVPEADVPEADVPEADAPEADAPETDALDADAPEADTPDADAPETDASDAEAPDADPEAAAAEGALEPAEPTEEMQAVLAQLAALGAEPLGTQGVEETRAQPTPADAVMALMEEQGIEPDPEQEAVLTRDLAIPGAAGEIPARLYTPAEGEGPFPLIVYYHGGGWVIADIDTYDASARALAAETGAVVLSASYRQAPENPFPAAHEDAFAAYVWAVENSGSLNADANRIAVAGESAGGNLAINVAIEARDRQTIQPVHQLLVYPLVGNDMQTPSYEAYADAEPLSREGLEWFVGHVFTGMEQTDDPRINVVERDDLGDLPPATIVNAEIDPLLSEGETLAQRLEEAGVEVEQRTFERVAHEFFGMGAVVPEAEEAVAFAAERLRAAFEEDE